MIAEITNTEDFKDDELFEHYNILATEGQKPLRIDKYLLNFIQNATRSKIQRAAKVGSIWVNDAQVKQNYKVKAGDRVRVLFEYPPNEYELLPEKLPLDIVYEDSDLLIVNKVAGMVVHPGHGNYTGTLINALLYHFEENGHKNIPLNSSLRPGLVHRIDKDTSGLLVIAKTDIAMSNLAKQFFEKTSEREYVALVWGIPKDNQGFIEGHIGRHLKNRLQMDVFEDGKYGKEAKTHYKVLESFGYVALVSCVLETGRTHQIRVHMEHIGHPIFNDERYGGDKILRGTTFTKYKQFVENCFKILPRQALHAKTLGFKHPTTGQFLRFDSDLPQDMKACIDKWRAYTDTIIS